MISNSVESDNEVGKKGIAHLTPQALKGGFEVALAHKPPMDWQSLLDYYRAHQISEVETVNEFGYGCLFVEDGEVGFFWVTDEPSTSQIKLSIHGIKPASLSTVVQRVRIMFDLDMDPPLSVKRGRALIAKLVELYGDTGSHPITGKQIRLFPRPETLATASMTSVGTTRLRRETLWALSSAVANGTIDLIARQDEAELRKQLMAISGIGIWSA